MRKFSLHSFNFDVNGFNKKLKLKNINENINANIFLAKKAIVFNLSRLGKLGKFK